MDTEIKDESEDEEEDDEDDGELTVGDERGCEVIKLFGNCS